MWSYTNVGVAGASIESYADLIDGFLGGITIKQQYALINLGVNGIAKQEEAVTKTNYQYIIDAIHTKWPLCIIYLAKPWMRGATAASATLAGWINDLIAANPGVVYAGHNESVWLEGGDDGVTMTSDGVHYNSTGNTECINQWVTVLGY